MDKRRDWPDPLLSYFEGSMLRQLNQLYILILAPLCFPTYFSSETGTRVSAYLTEEVRAKQNEFLAQYAHVVKEALEQGCAGEHPAEDEMQTPESVVRALMEQIHEKYPRTLPHIGKDLICRAGNRFLSGFALEEAPRSERIRAMKDYYRLCIRFFYPADTDGSQKQQLCDCLLGDLQSGGVWDSACALPEDPAERAAHLLLAYLFLKYYTQQSFDAVPETVRRQLREASIALGFVDPSAQQLSRRFVEVDAQMLQDVIMIPLEREFRSYQDSDWIWISITQTLGLLKDGDAILPGFSQWLNKAGETLMNHDQWLYTAFSAASAEERREIRDAQNRISELRKIIRDLQC